MSNPARDPRRLPRVAKLFGAVSLLNDFASEMIYPLLPAFVTGVLGAGAEALGVLDGAAEFAASVVKFGAGRVADRPGRRGRLVVAGYAIAVLVRPIIGWTAAAWQVVGLRVVDRVGKGIRTPARDAMIADATPAELRGRAFGLQRGLDHAGAVLGPVAAWWLLATHRADLRDVIAASIVPGIAVLLLAGWAVRDARRSGGGAALEEPAGTAPDRAVVQPAFFAISAFYLLRMPETLVILRSQELGVPIATIPLLWAAVHVVKSSSSFVGGQWTDRLGAERTMWGGWVCYALLAAAMAVAATAATAWGVFLALGLVAGLTESPERALVAKYAGGHQGSGFGVYHGVTGLAALGGGLVLGSVFQRFGAPTAFFASASAGLALALVGPIIWVRHPTKEVR